MKFRIWIDRHEQWPADAIPLPESTVTASNHEQAAERYAASAYRSSTWCDLIVANEEDVYKRISVRAVWACEECVDASLDALRAP